MDRKILTSDHPRWDEFIDKLRYAMTRHAEFESDCSCSGDLKISKRILDTMQEVDTESSLEYIRTTFGECDCVVLKITS